MVGPVEIKEATRILQENLYFVCVRMFVEEQCQANLRSPPPAGWELRASITSDKYSSQLVKFSHQSLGHKFKVS